MDAGGAALEPLKQQQSSTGRGRRPDPGRQADLQRGFGKINFNFPRGTSAKSSRTSTFPSAGHTQRLCQSNLPWLSLDSTGSRNHLPRKKHKTLFLNFLRNAISDTSGIFPLTINPPNLCSLISKHSSLFRQTVSKLRQRNTLLKENKVLWLLPVRCKRRPGNCLLFLKSCWCVDSERNCHLLNYQQVRLPAQPGVPELC